MNTKTWALSLLSVALTACGSSANFDKSIAQPIAAVDAVQDDGSVVHGRAMVTVTTEQESALAKLFGVFLPTAFASNGSTTVTYTNSASTLFSLNSAQFTPGSITGDFLSLGSISLSVLSDNNLKVCGTGSNTKCNGAVIRVYTTGSVAGFVNTVDNYGVPVFTGTLNPTTALGLLTAGSVPVQTLGTIASTKHTVTIADFPSPTYSATANFSNAGAGNYSMTYVVEYALTP